MDPICGVNLRRRNEDRFRLAKRQGRLADNEDVPFDLWPQGGPTDD